MSADEMITQQTGPNQVIHARQDSTQELNDLFAESLKNVKNSTPSSWLKRNMPPSFFVPSHSRESSLDPDATQPNPNNGGPPSFNAGPHTHVRGHSCPAGMYDDRSRAHREKPGHVRSPSLTMILDLDDERIPLPAGWEVAHTADGRTYFIDHNTKTTSWVDPRKQFLNKPPTPSHPPPQPLTVADILSLPLPQGWERAVGGNNDVYFINHDARTTSWYDPRLPQQLQLPGGRLKPGVSLSSFVNSQPGGPTPVQDGQSPVMSQGSPVIPPGHQMSPLGAHQRMASNEALAGPGGPVHQRMASGGSGEGPASSRMTAEYQRRVQEEVMRQNMMRRQPMSPTDVMDMGGGGMSPGDPFIAGGGGSAAGFSAPTGGGGGEAVNRVHSKQGSGDSGLGGMGGSFPVQPRPPNQEEFMEETMDEVSKHSGAGGGVHIAGGQRMSGGGGPAQMNTMNNNNNEMDADNTEDLMPSLSADLSSDILDDVLNSNSDMLNSNSKDLVWL